MHTAGCPQSLLGASRRRALAWASPQEPPRRQGWPARHPPGRSAARGGPHPAPRPLRVWCSSSETGSPGSRRLDTSSTGASANLRARCRTRRRCCRLGPLQVVQQEDQRATRGQPAEQIGRGGEREEAFGRVIGPCRPRGGGDYARRRGDPRQFTPTTGDMVGQQVKGARARRTNQGGYGRARGVRPSHRSGRRGRLPSTLRTGRTQPATWSYRSRAHPRESRSADPIPSPPARRLRRWRSASAPDEFAAVGQLGRKRHDERCPSSLCKLGPDSAPIPAGRDPTLGPDHLWCGFGSQLLNEQRPVVLEGAQRVCLPPCTRQRPDQQRRP